jgi:hypothetical protein
MQICLRQQGTHFFIRISFFRSQSEKTKYKKKEKYRCEPLLAEACIGLAK